MLGREIVHSPGTPFSKPSMTLAGISIVSVFVLLQVVGLAVMVWYVNTAPTWAPGLDAMAIARIGRAMRGGELPPIGPISTGDMDKLREMDARVGIVDNSGRESPRLREPEGVAEDQPGPDRPLMDKDSAGAGDDGGLMFGLGAKGLITRGVVLEKPSWFGKTRKKVPVGNV